MNLRYIFEGEPGFLLNQLVDGGAIYSDGRGAGGLHFVLLLFREDCGGIKRSFFYMLDSRFLRLPNWLWRQGFR